MFMLKLFPSVSSNQMQQIRISLRGSAEVLMGKNTMMRKVIRGRLDQNPALEKVCFRYASEKKTFILGKCKMIIFMILLYPTLYPTLS